MGTGGRAGGGGGGAAAGAVVPEDSYGRITNMTPEEIRGLSRDQQAKSFANGSSITDERKTILENVHKSNINTPNDGRYVATAQEYANFMSVGGDTIGRRGFNDAERIGRRRDGTMDGERAYLRDTTVFANRMTANPTRANLTRLARAANGAEDINDHNGAHIMRTKGALALAQRLGTKTK